MHGYIWTGQTLQMCGAFMMSFFFFLFPLPACQCARATLSILLWGVQVPLFINVVHFLSDGLRPDPILQLGLPNIPHTRLELRERPAVRRGASSGMSLLSQGGRSGGRGREEGAREEGRERGSAVLLGCLWSGFHHPVFDHLPGDDTASEVRASGPGRIARASNFRAGAFLNRYPRCYQRPCHVDYLTAFTDVTLGWLRSHFRVCARLLPRIAAHSLSHWRGTTQWSHAARARGGARAFACRWRTASERLVSERNADL